MARGSCHARRQGRVGAGRRSCFKVLVNAVMTLTADIVIIGGGIHGCSLAFHLAAANAGSVILIEKDHIAAGPTGQSGAMIRALYNDKIYTDLVTASTRMFEQ